MMKNLRCHGVRRFAAALVLASSLFLVFPSAASAQDVTVESAIKDIDNARKLVADSVELHEDGNFDDAYSAARNAYLDHFELVEIPLRVRDESLTLEVEEDFANLRNLIESEEADSEVQTAAAEVQQGLNKVERALSKPGLGAPAIAFGYSFTILFREGLEAVLIVAALLGYLQASRNNQYRPAILKGVGAAAVATVITFFVATAIIRLAPVQREVMEAGTALLAVGMLFYVSFWLVARLDQRRWMEFIKAKVWSAAASGSAFALGAVGFTAVYREGFETVLFYQSLLTFSQGLTAYVLAGAGVAAIALGVLGWFILVAGKRVPIKTFLGIAVTLIMGMSVAFMGNAVRGFQEAALIPVTFLELVPRLPIFLAQLTGWYATRETLMAQGALLLLYLAGALWTFVVIPRRARRHQVPETMDLRSQEEPSQTSERVPVR